MVDIQTQIKSARKNLLDLTMRNRLLNFRPNKARSIRVVGEIPREVYDLLVLQERMMEFQPQKQRNNTTEKSSRESLFGEIGDNGLSDEGLTELWQLPITTTEVADRHLDRYLQTELDSEGLQKRLFYISQQARSVFEEQGYTVLFLALGFLEWKESPDAIEMRRAPLILVPVELERTDVRKSYRLKWNEEDIYSNISLSAKLVEQGIILPFFEMPEEKTGVDQYFVAVSSAISTMTDWKVVNEIYLDFFSFTKFVMYKDLDSKSWPTEESLTQHPLIKAILDPSGEVTHSVGFDVEEVDQKIQWKNTYHILDADPYQIAVIEDAKAGHNLVVEGPPGTGKSQTIANTIAELLANGKTVLFVSEKMAALEVVKSRLDRAGLGEFCLELHSRKANKREVLKELERTLQADTIHTSDKGMDFREHEDLKNKLNGYVTALREHIGNMQYSPFALYQMKEKSLRHFKRSGMTMPRAKIPSPEKCTIENWSLAQTRLNDLVSSYSLVKPVLKNTWRGCNPPAILPSDESEIGNLIEMCIFGLNKLVSAAQQLTEKSGIRRPDCFADIQVVVSSSAIVSFAPKIERIILENRAWDTAKEQTQSIINDLQEFQKQRAIAITTFKENSLDLDLQPLLDDYKFESTRILRFLSKKYRYLKREITGLFKHQPFRKREQIVEHLEHLIAVQNLQTRVTSHEKAAGKLFGSLWKGKQTNCETLSTFSDWIISFRASLNAGTITNNALSIIEKGINKLDIEEAYKHLLDSSTDLVSQLENLRASVGLNYLMAFSSEREDIQFATLKSRLTEWSKNTHTLHKWSQFIRHRNVCIETVVASVISLVDSDSIMPDSVVPCFEGNFADDLLRFAFDQRSDLADFIGKLHEQKIKRFSEVDQLLITTNRKRLVSKLQKNKPVVYGGARGSEVGVLLGEFGRKRSHMPIRKLMLRSGTLIQKLKPCFMMSPLSIAQFLDPRTVKFDVIIFDEASQVKPEDALGALLRGEQLIVMGDTKQLPPTNFFSHLIGEGTEEEEAEEATVADVESILHQCKRAFPTKSLNWHYRSRHESLIAVSNREFYDNSLLIFPSSIDKADYLGLHFVHLSDGLYDRGKSGVNRIEARAVAEAAVHHFRQHPAKSLGIGTFNIKQQQAIQEEVELQLRHNPEMEEYFKSGRDEHFFVKNLETIQGDERDVIFVSVGFGFDEAHRLTQNFGPLNHDGGHRRLNVLATRAREKCVVFSNFKASDLSIEADTPFGVRALKSFLAFAENRKTIGTQGPFEDTDSPFEDSVFEFLTSKGYIVRKQVGCASFRVDLAVVDSKNLGRYILGIECDGAKYHSSPVARDRDRLRQQVLEGLGWKIHRIWSTDWYRNRIDVQDRLISAVKEAAHEPHSSELIKREQSSSSATEPGLVKSPNDTNRSFTIPNIEELAKPYQVCQSLGVQKRGDLHEQSTHHLADAVINVVKVEGPVHFDEVVRRIRTLWGLGRAGQRINTVVNDATKQAIKAGLIKQKDGFLWPVEVPDPIPVRRRIDDPLPQIDLISKEEITEAIKLVLRYQFSTDTWEVVTQVARLFGFQSTHDKTSKRIMNVLKQLIKNGELEAGSDGIIRLSEKK